MTKDEALDLALRALLINCGGNTEGIGKEAIAAIKQALAAPTVQEPSYWLGYGLQAHTEKPFEDATPLYTTPPAAQRQWVGLTDEDKLHIEIMGGKSDVMLAEMIEAKLKEKNT